MQLKLLIKIFLVHFFTTFFQNMFLELLLVEKCCTWVSLSWHSDTEGITCYLFFLQCEEMDMPLFKWLPRANSLQAYRLACTCACIISIKTNSLDRILPHAARSRFLRYYSESVFAYYPHGLSLSKIIKLFSMRNSMISKSISQILVRTAWENSVLLHAASSL